MTAFLQLCAVARNKAGEGAKVRSCTEGITASGRTLYLPVVERRAPELPGLRERVGRDAAHDHGCSGLAELEELGKAPYVRALRADVNRHVAHNRDVALVRVRSHSPPLTVEEELFGDKALNIVAPLRGGLLEGSRFPKPAESTQIR